MLIALVYNTQIDKRIHLPCMQINTWISKGREEKKRKHKRYPGGNNNTRLLS